MATRLSDIEESQKIQNPHEHVPLSSLPVGETSKDAAHVIFRLVQSNRNGGVYLPSIQDCICPVKKTSRRARLLSGVSTIWLDEQKDYDKDYARSYSRTLEFPRGSRMLLLDASDTSAIDFARLSPHNIKSKNLKTGSKMEFYEYNPKAQQEEALAKEMLEIEMAIEASKVESIAMRKHAFFLGVQPNDDLGQPKSDNGIRREYILAAKRNPEHFKNTLGSVEIEVHYLVRKAIQESLIDLGSGSGSVSWSKGGGFICHVPKGEVQQVYLTKFALMPTPEGKEFLQTLKQNVTS